LQLNIKQGELLTDLQQNAFHLISDHSENLIIQHMRRVAPRPVLLFTRKKLHQLKRQISGTCSKLSSINFFSYEDPGKHTRGP
jgi:hypothetical protein